MRARLSEVWRTAQRIVSETKRRKNYFFFVIYLLNLHTN